jgi:hypothetical protein
MLAHVLLITLETMWTTTELRDPDIMPGRALGPASAAAAYANWPASADIPAKLRYFFSNFKPPFISCHVYNM